MMYWDKLGAGYSRDNLNLVDPITGRKVKAIKVEQPKDTVQNPNGPLSITLTFHNIRGQEEKSEVGRIALWKGVDIRGGTLYIQTLLNVFNCIWDHSKINPKPQIRTYRCIPIAKTFGCTEMLEPSTSAKNFDWNSLAQSPDSVRMKLAASMAAAIISAWVLGFRDKLEDHLYVHKDELYFSGVDKVHLWNSKQLDFDFINKLRPYLTLLNGGWGYFQNLCSETFKALYDKGSIIEKICCTMYSNLHEKDMVDSFISGTKSLMLNVPPAEAQAQFINALNLNETGSLKSLFKKMKPKFAKK